MPHRVTYEPVKQLAWDAELRCERLRTVGHRAVCSCGWKGSVRSTVARARETTAEHLDAVSDHGTRSEPR